MIHKGLTGLAVASPPAGSIQGTSVGWVESGLRLRHIVPFAVRSQVTWLEASIAGHQIAVPVHAVARTATEYFGSGLDTPAHRREIGVVPSGPVPTEYS